MPLHVYVLFNSFVFVLFPRNMCPIVTVKLKATYVLTNYERR